MRNQIRNHRKIVRASALLAAVLGCPMIASAATDNWVSASSGNWSNSGVAFWSTGSQPQAGDTVNLTKSGAVITITYDAGATGVTLGTLTIDDMTLTQALNNGLSAGSEIVGSTSNGPGTFNQSNGTNSITGNLTLGNGGTASNGTYNLTGSGTMSAASETIGGIGGGAGAFLENTSGSNTVAGTLSVGNAGASASSYMLNSGTLTAGTIQLNTNGTFADNGGTLNATNFNMNAGTFTGVLQNQHAFTYTGGTFTGLLVNTGTVTLNNDFTCVGLTQSSATVLSIASGRTVTVIGGSGTNDNGTINLAGTLNASFGETIGGTAAGTVTQTGTSVASFGTLSIGTGATVSGTYNLQGGTLGVLAGTTINVGPNGTLLQTGGTVNAGTIAQSGGSVTLSDLTIASSYAGNASTAFYSISGGTLTTPSIKINAGGELLIQATAGPGAVATPLISQNSGTFLGTLNVSTGNVLTYNFNGGSFGPSNFSIANGGTFNQNAAFATAFNVNQTGGNANFLAMNIGSPSGGPNSYFLSGGVLSAGGAIAVSTGGSFNQTGGAFAANTMFTVNGGNVTGILQDSGAFVYNSGTFAGAQLSILPGATATIIANFTADGLTTTSLAKIVEASGTLITLNSGGLIDDGAFPLSTSVSLVGKSEVVGNVASGTLNQFGVGSSNTVLNTLTIAAQAGSTGSYLLSAGVLTSPTIVVNTGGDLNQSSGGFFTAGTYTLAGGTTEVSGVFDIAPSGGGNGNATTFNLSAGTVSASQIEIDAGGTLNQTGGTLNTPLFVQTGGTYIGTFVNLTSFTYSGGTFTGRLINQGTATINGNFSPSNGIENDTSLTVALGQAITANGAGLDNLGTLTLNGGTLAGSGSVVNDFGGSFTGHGTISAAFSNLGTATISGLLNVNAAFSNTGVIAIPLTDSLRIGTGSGFTNAGVVNLGGGALSGSGTITNSTGLIQGNGGVSAAINNVGGIIFASTAAMSLTVSNLTANIGQLKAGAGSTLAITNPFTNSGIVNPAGPSAIISGGAITNNGTIKGIGTVNNVVANTTGIVRAEGGELDLAASGNTNNGQIQASSGNTVLYVQGLTTNAGTIALTGGAFDNNNVALSNVGTNSGNGIVRTGGLTNAGTMLFTDAATSVFGPVINNGGAAPGTIKIVSNTTSFFGNVTNNGTIKVTSGVARFLGNGVSMTVGGTYNSDPSDNYFNGLAVTSGGNVLGGNGDRFFLTGGTALTNDGNWNVTGTLSSNAVANTGTFTQTGTLIETANFTNSGTVTIGGVQNWSGGTTFANTAGATTFQSDAGSTTATPLSINGTGGSVTFGSTQHLASVSLSGGATASVTSGGDKVVRANTVSIAAGSKIDLSDNKLITQSAVGSWNGSAYSGVLGLAVSGRLATSQASATSGLTTIAVAANSDLNKTTFGGESVGGSDVLVMYTYAGDADLTGKITGDDYFRIDSGYAAHATGYDNGDFNLDGRIDADDYFIIDRNYSRQGTAFSASEPVMLDGVQMVPEPGVVGVVLGLAGAGALSRKRRNAGICSFAESADSC